MVDVRFCPYCERWLDEGPLRRLWAGRRAVGASVRRASVLSERTLLATGLAVFGLIAAACIVAAALVA